MKNLATYILLFSVTWNVTFKPLMGKPEVPQQRTKQVSSSKELIEFIKNSPEPKSWFGCEDIKTKRVGTCSISNLEIAPNR